MTVAIDEATHVLKWGPWCGGPDGRTADGLWELATMEDHVADQPTQNDDWYVSGSGNASPESLHQWVENILGYPVEFVYSTRVAKRPGLHLPHIRSLFYVIPKA